MGALEAVAQVLGEAGGPLHYREITERIIARKLWATAGKTPDQTVYTALLVDARRGAAARFERGERGMFSLRRKPQHAAAEVSARTGRYTNDALAARQALDDLARLLQIKASVAMHRDISEPLVCHLMGWTRIRGNAAHDAESDDGARIQIKYSMEGFVGCKPASVAAWEHMAWVHAPHRLPKLLILIPSAVLAAAKFSSNTLNILENIDVLRAQRSDLRAWRFPVENLRDLRRLVEEGSRPPKASVREVLTELEHDLLRKQAEHRRARGPSPARKPRAVAAVVARPAPPAGSPRGDLSQLNGRAFAARWRGPATTARVEDGVLRVDGVDGKSFTSLSAAARHVAGYAVNGRRFWRET